MMAVSTYTHTQPAWVIRILIGIFIPFNIILTYLVDEKDKAALPFIILALCLLLFGLWSMTIQITSTHLSHWFSVGFWKKSYPLTAIQSIQRSQSKWYNGYGIRYVGNGCMYNVSGKDRLTLLFQDGTTIHLGTDDLEALYQHLATETLD